MKIIVSFQVVLVSPDLFGDRSNPGAHLLLHKASLAPSFDADDVCCL